MDKNIRLHHFGPGDCFCDTEGAPANEKCPFPMSLYDARQVRIREMR